MTYPRKDDPRENGQRFLILAGLLLLLPLNVMAQQAGDLDATFGVGGKVLTDISGNNDEGQDVVLQPDGKIVVAGYSPIVQKGSSSLPWCAICPMAAWIRVLAMAAWCSPASGASMRWRTPLRCNRTAESSPPVSPSITAAPGASPSRATCLTAPWIRPSAVMAS